MVSSLRYIRGEIRTIQDQLRSAQSIGLPLRKVSMNRTITTARVRTGVVVDESDLVKAIDLVELQLFTKPRWIPKFNSPRAPMLGLSLYRRNYLSN